MAAFSENFKILYKLSYYVNFGVPLVHHGGFEKKVHFAYRRYISHVHVCCTNLCLVLGPAVEVSPD